MRRFRFEKVYNLRELGGYQTPNGDTKYGVYLRSDNISFLTENEIKMLKAYGLKRVIDFRHRLEIVEEPDPFEKDNDVLYQNFTYDGLVDYTDEDFDKIHMSKLYITLCEVQEFIQPVFTALALEEGTVLFHCSAGKDRTGVIAAILLKLVGVDFYDIVADYQVSKTYLDHKYKDNQDYSFLKYLNINDSKPETMIEFLNYLDEKYDSIEAYLNSKGVTQKQIEQIRSKFIERI